MIVLVSGSTDLVNEHLLGQSFTGNWTIKQTNKTLRLPSTGMINIDGIQNYSLFTNVTEEDGETIIEPAQQVGGEIEIFFYSVSKLDEEGNSFDVPQIYCELYELRYRTDKMMMIDQPLPANNWEDLKY